MLQVDCGWQGMGEKTEEILCFELAWSFWTFGVSRCWLLWPGCLLAFKGSALKRCFASKKEGVCMMPPITFSLLGPLNKLRKASATSLLMHWGFSELFLFGVANIP